MTLGVKKRLERASRILVIVTPELPALKDTKDVLENFRCVLNIPAGSVSVDFNDPRGGTMVTRADVERGIGRDVQLGLDHDGFRCDRAGVTGEVLVNSAPGSPVAKALRLLATSVAEEYKGRAVAEAKV